MLATRIKQWEHAIAEQKLKEGREEGREEGRQEGRREGEAIALIKVLQSKFGPLPDWAKQKINQAEAALIDQWLTKQLIAETLEDVFK